MTQKNKVATKDNIVYILPSSNQELKGFILKNKLDVMEQVISSIEYALQHGLPMVEVFQFKNSEFIVTISEKEFQSNLDNIFKCYMENEIYELCPRVIRLQNLVKRKIDEKQKATQNRRSNNKQSK
jgi:hypothetical protein